MGIYELKSTKLNSKIYDIHNYLCSRRQTQIVFVFSIYNKIEDEKSEDFYMMHGHDNMVQWWCNDGVMVNGKGCKPGDPGSTKPLQID